MHKRIYGFNIIIGLFIRRRKPVHSNAVRKFVFSDKEPQIQDRFEGIAENIQSLQSAENFTTIYMASSKYYRHSDLVSGPSNLNSKIPLVVSPPEAHAWLQCTFLIGNKDAA